MKILVTGGTGGLGREIVPAAEAAGHTVRIGSREARWEGVDDRREWARIDVETGIGLRQALDGVDAVIHAATHPRRHAGVDVEGTRVLAAAAREAGITHLAYVSIVGIDEIPVAYYRSKLAAERIVASAGVPFSILRATQFHSLVDRTLYTFARTPLVFPVPASFRCQSVAASEVAKRLVRALEHGPAGRLPDFGGPEVLTLGEMARAWKAARGVWKPIVPIPVFGGPASAFKQGKATLRGGERGTVRWEDWLRNPESPA